MVIEAMEEERFMILSHPQVQEYVQRKAADRDRWLSGMRRLRDKIYGRGAVRCFPPRCDELYPRILRSAKRVSKDDGHGMASWFETAHARLLTMRV